MESAITFSDDSLNPAVRGCLHSPENPNGDALVLTHGAGSNCNAPLLVALSEAFREHGYVVLRCDLPFRCGIAHLHSARLDSENRRAGR